MAPSVGRRAIVVNVVPPLVEAISALSYVAGLLDGRGEKDPAGHRCAQAAAGLQVIVLDALEDDETED